MGRKKTKEENHMKRMLAALLMLALLCAAVPVFAEEEMEPMYTLTAPYGFKLGASLSFDQLRNQKYLKSLQKSLKLNQNLNRQPSRNRNSPKNPKNMNTKPLQ